MWKSLEDKYSAKTFRVHSLGHRDDMPRLSGIHIVTLVSKAEGLPRCIMELWLLADLW